MYIYKHSALLNERSQGQLASVTDKREPNIRKIAFAFGLNKSDVTYGKDLKKILSKNFKVDKFLKSREKLEWFSRHFYRLLQASEGA